MQQATCRQPLLRSDTAWIVLAVALWTGVAFYKPNVARVLVFDVVVIGLFVFLVGRRLLGRGGALRTTAPRWFWICLAVLAGAAFASGIQAWDLEFWGVEAASLFYVGAMAFTVDLITAERQDRWIDVGARVFAIIALVTGVVGVLFILTGLKIDVFYEVHRGVITDKLVGPMRMCNQWASYCVALFPVTLGVAMRTRHRAWQALLLVGALMCLLSVPASGSRSGGFLVFAEAAGFCLLYITFGRVRRALLRLLAVGVLLGVVGMTFVAAGDGFREAPLVKRSFKSFSMVVEDEEVTDDWRSGNWERALNSFSESPVIGIGVGNFRVKGGDQHEIHNAYLSVLTEAGLLGAIPYYFLLGMTLLGLGLALLRNARSGKVDPVTVGLLVAMTGILIFGVYHNHTRQRYAWMVIAFSAGYAATQLSRQRWFTVRPSERGTCLHGGPAE